VDLDVQFQDPFQPLAVVPGSELTLQEDGTWTQPAPAQAGTPVAATPQGVEAPAPSLASAPQAPLPQVTTASNAVQPTDVLPEPSAQIPAQAPVSAPPAAPQAVVLTPASPVLTQSPAPVQAPRAPQPETAVRATDGADESQPALADAFKAPADERVQARRSADEGSFTSLANPNLGAQDPLKALAQQTARDYAVRESVFKQVYEALREAPGTDNGRMLIRLKPAELGEVHVDLTLVNGKLSARLVASQAEVRDAFFRDLPGFKAGLESQGLAVRDISVAVRAGIAGQQDQPAPQQQPDPQAWWRELPRQDQTPGLGTPASAGYTNLSVTDQRFSALA
jgi:flagellar hook-length control protein FliK